MLSVRYLLTFISRFYRVRTACGLVRLCEDLYFLFAFAERAVPSCSAFCFACVGFAGSLLVGYAGTGRAAKH